MIDATATPNEDFSTIEGLAGALDWWRGAGVDFDFADEPSGWLAEPKEKHEEPLRERDAKPDRSPPRQRTITPGGGQERIGGSPETWPTDLAAFREWWMAEPSLAETGADRRVPPRGGEGARIMVLVGQPERDDGEVLLSGVSGKLLSAILRAMCIGEGEPYIAGALPAPMAMPHWQELAARGLDEVTRHHVSLAAPERLLVFGRELLPLFGIDAAQARAPARLDLGDISLPLLPAPSLDRLARSAARRERFWKSWLDWTQ